MSIVHHERMTRYRRRSSRVSITVKRLADLANTPLAPCEVESCNYVATFEKKCYFHRQVAIVHKGENLSWR